MNHFTNDGKLKSLMREADRKDLKTNPYDVFTLCLASSAEFYRIGTEFILNLENEYLEKYYNQFINSSDNLIEILQEIATEQGLSIIINDGVDTSK